MSDSINKKQIIKIAKNSGVALKQMNYEVNRNLTADQVKEKKEKLKIPDGPLPFGQDIIDLMGEYENSVIFNMKAPDYHDANCKAQNDSNNPCC
jgi:hypothetical protein